RLGPVRGVRRLLVAGRLHLACDLGRQPPPLDQPADKARDRVVAGSLGDLLLRSVLEMVVLGRVRVDTPDLGVDESGPLGSPGLRDRLARDLVAGRYVRAVDG